MVSISKTLGKFICWVNQYNVCWKNHWKILGVFLLVPYFQSMIELVSHVSHLGLHTFFILGPNTYLLGIMLI